MINLNQRHSDHCQLTSLALQHIGLAAHLDLTGWTGPEVRAEGGTYKLDWFAPDYNDSGTYLTLYEDGVWQLYANGHDQEGKITPLHHRTWVKRLCGQQVPGQIAFFAVEFFKQLKCQHRHKQLKEKKRACR